MTTSSCCAVLLLIAATGAASDRLAAGRTALDALDYETAIAELDAVAGDTTVDGALRARAFMLIAEATFGTAGDDAEARAISALKHALALDPGIDFERRDYVSPRLLSVFDALAKPTSTTPAPQPQAPPDPPPLSSWWLASGALAGGAVVAGGVAGGLEAYVSLVRPSPDDPPSLHNTAVTVERVAVVVAVAAVVAAAGAGTVALLEP